MEIGLGIGIPQLLSFKARGAASPYDPASDAIFAAFTTPPTTARKAIIDAAVVSLKAAGVWAKLDALYAFAAADSQAALINWKQPGMYNASAVNSPTFTADRGFTGASTKYIDTGFNPTTAPTPKFVRDSASMFAWCTNNVELDAGPVGNAPSNTSLVYPRYLGNFYLRANNDVTNISGASSDSTGFWVTNRSASNLQSAYKNGASIGSNAGVSAALASYTFSFLKAQFTTYWVGGEVAGGGFGQSLNSTEQTALYNALAAYMVGLAGVTLEAETLAIIAGMTAPPTPARRISINNAVVALKTAGVWTKLDALYLFAAHTSQAAIVNWKQPGTYNGTAVNSPTFTTDVGYTHDAIGKWIDTGFTPSTAPSPKFVQNSGCIFGWSNTSGVLNGPMIGAQTANDFADIYPRYTGDHYYSRVNNQTNNVDVASTDGRGFFSVSRSSSSLTTAYKNGVSVGTSALASTGVDATVIRFGAGNAVPWGVGQCCGGGIGQNLDATEQLALYNALANYLADIATEKIIAAFTTPPTTARATLIRDTTRSLMQAGVWNKLDALYMFAAADSQAALINWKQPGTYNATLVNSPAFVADQGFTGASTKYLDSGFNPTTAPSPKFVRDSATVFAWSIQTIAANGLFGQGALGGAGETFCHPKYSDNNFYGSVNDGTGGTVIANVFGNGGSGLWVNSRSGPNTVNFYHDGGASFASGTQASQVPHNSTILFLSRGSQYYAGTISCGGVGSSLTQADSTALYNALANYRADIAAEKITAAFTTPPTTARATLIRNTTRSLMQAGVWDKLDALYMFAAADSQAALINWKQPGTYNATAVNSPAFTADRGFTGASTKHLNSNFNPTTAPTPKMSQNSATVFGHSITNAQGGLVGNGTGSGLILLYPWHVTNIYLGRINTTVHISVGNSNSIGFWSVNRSGALAQEAYKNGAPYGSNTGGSGAPESGNLFFLRGVSASSDDMVGGQIACGGFGQSLTAAEQLALYNALRTYMTGVGVP